MTYEEALRKLNSAVYDTIRACKDTTQYPDVDRQFLRELATKTDRMVDDLPSGLKMTDSGEIFEVRND